MVLGTREAQPSHGERSFYTDAWVRVVTVRSLKSERQSFPTLKLICV